MNVDQEADRTARLTGSFKQEPAASWVTPHKSASEKFVVS